MTGKLPKIASSKTWCIHSIRYISVLAGPEGNQLWAHAIAQPERGCLILAHPLMFKSHQQYFDQVASSDTRTFSLRVHVNRECLSQHHASQDTLLNPYQSYIKQNRAVVSISAEVCTDFGFFL